MTQAVAKLVEEFSNLSPEERDEFQCAAKEREADETEKEASERNRFVRLRGSKHFDLTTDEWMEATRGE